MEFSIESLHIIRSMNMQTRYRCCHDTCLPLPALDDQTYTSIDILKMKKKSHCLKQTNAPRKRGREVLERQTTIFHTLFERMQIEIIEERERHTNRSTDDQLDRCLKRRA